MSMTPVIILWPSLLHLPLWWNGCLTWGLEGLAYGRFGWRERKSKKMEREKENLRIVDTWRLFDRCYGIYIDF